MRIIKIYIAKQLKWIREILNWSKLQFYSLRTSSDLMTSLIIKTSSNTLIKCKYCQHYGDYNIVFYDVGCNNHSRERKVLSRDVPTPTSFFRFTSRERHFIPHKPVKYLKLSCKNTMTILQDTFLLTTNNTLSADVLTGHCFQKESQKQGWTNTGPQVATASTFCTRAPNAFRPSTRNLRFIALLEPRISRWLPEVCKICARLL